MKFTCATYNILHGYHKEKIFKNIKFLISKGVDIICIQEDEIPLDSVLPPGWQISYFHGQIHGCALAVLWNTPKLNLIKENKFFLPVSAKRSFLKKITNFKNTPLQRGCLSLTFSIGGKTLRVNNIHLSWESDTNHRLKQIRHIFTTLEEEKVDTEIFIGDFNTVTPLTFKRFQEKKLEQCFSDQYINVFPRLKYSCGYVSEFDPSDGLVKLKKFLGFCGIYLKSRLDYMFARNLKIDSTEMLDLKGSDHMPLIATFEVY